MTGFEKLGGKSIFLLSLLFALVVSSVLLLVFSFSFTKIDMVTTVTEVIDGDTFDISGNRIRLADIDAPEINDIGYGEAKNFLRLLLENQPVYLDVDDYGSTTHERMVCVAYFRYNSTHLLNVNKELLDLGYAAVWEHENNEFNSNVWTEFVYYPTNIETILQLITNNIFRLMLESLAIILVIMIIISILHIDIKTRLTKHKLASTRLEVT